MRERKQNSVTFCFDSIAGKMAHVDKNHDFFLYLIYKHADICETTLIRKRGREGGREKSLYLLSFLSRIYDKNHKKRDEMVNRI